MVKRSHRGVAWSLSVLAIAGLIVAGHAVSDTTLHLPPWSPAFGVASGLVLVGGVSFAVPVLAGHLLAAWVLGWLAPPPVAGWISFAGFLVATLLGAGLRRVLDPRPASWTVRQVGVLIASAIAAGALFAALTVPAVVGTVSADTGSTVFRSVVGVAVGVLLGLPAVAAVVESLDARPSTSSSARRVDAGELALHATLVLVVCGAGYVLRGPTGERFWSLYFIPLIWTAFRYGMPGVVAAHVLVSAQAIVLALVLRTPLSTLTNFHFFLFNFCASTLLLAAALGARRSAERARGRSEALLAGAFRVTHHALVVFRRSDGSMLDVNDAFAELIGRPRDALLGRSLASLGEWTPETRVALRDVAGVHEATRAFRGEVRRGAGDARFVLVDVEPVTVDDETYGVAIIQDVTEARLRERQRLQSQKLEAVGLLAGGVAHDFNNILTVVSSSAGFLLESIDEHDDRRVDVDSILDAANRGAQLTRQLLAFSRQRPDAPARPIDVAEVVAGMSSLLGRLLGGDIRIVTEMTPGAVRVLAAPGQVEQVVLNLAVNARDAMIGSGTLTIRAAERVLHEPEPVAAVAGVVPAGRWAVLCVQDSGEGIDPAIVARIFEPFFTTKPEGVGTGLGLSTVYGILRSVGGHVGVQSAPGQGTTFVLYWPSAADG
jgi:PAS domain S-box-containing protein